jgi:hypothetical protein
MTPYDDIIGLEHPTSMRHPRMSLSDRAAQFSSFAALRGFEEELDHTLEERLAEAPPDPEDAFYEIRDE